MPGVPSVWVPALPVDELANAARSRRPPSPHRPRHASRLIADDLALCRAYAARQSGPAGRQTGDLLQITKYRVARNAAAHRFPQVSELIKAELAPGLPLRSGTLAGLLFELYF